MLHDAVLAVSAVIVDRDNRVLLVLRGHEPAKGLWSLPGGSVEPGERMAEALVREVREETGLSIVVGDEVWRAHIELAAGKPYDIHTFLVTEFSGHLVAGDDAERAEFVPESTFEERETTFRLKEVLQAAGWPRA